MISTDGSTIKSKYMFNATVDYFHPHIYMSNISREGFRTITVVWVTEEKGGGGGEIEDRLTTILIPSGM